MSRQITLIGAGLVGSLLSIYLARRGYKVKIFERRPDMRKSTISAGKSINLALSDRGFRGLEGVGIADEIRKIGIPMYGRFIHNQNSSTNFLPYGKKDQAIYSVSRGGINCRLMDLAEQEKNVSIHFNERCVGIDIEHKVCRFENSETGETTEINSDLILGADGAFSAARLQMQLSQDRFDYQQFYIDAGYKELTIPSFDGKFVLEKNALHIWPRGKFMMIALPNPDGSFTCTLFFPFEGENSFSALTTPAKVETFFKEIFPDAVPLMPTLLDDYFLNPTSSLVTVKCFPWRVKDSMCLIGDAAHAIVPFFGQGMNCGFEDCVVFDRLMNSYGDNWDKILQEFELSRKPDADAIAELALQNFIEMRDLVAKPDFILRKKIEARFSERHPGRWVPLYSMVTFSPDIRYSEALTEGKLQDRIMEEVMAIPGIQERWESEDVEQLMMARLSGE